MLFYKILRLIIIYILTYYVLGTALIFVLKPLFDLNSNIYWHGLINRIVFAIVAGVAYFIAGKFLVLERGEGNKIALIISGLTFAIGLAAIIWQRVAINIALRGSGFNAADLQYIQQQSSYGYSILSLVIQTLIAYYFGKYILVRSEKIS